MDVGEMQKKLSRWATEEPEKRFTDLYSLLCNEDWLRVAHQKVNTNQGRDTAGIDGISMSKFNEDQYGNLEKLQGLLKTKTFEPLPVRRVYIPKANGKKRPLGIPGIRDRIVQEALRMILEPIWESDFSTQSYGFRPNRGTYDAIAYISNRITGFGAAYQWVIEGDIASYFDTIPHQKLDKAVKKRIADKNIRDLIWKFLRAGVMYRDKEYETLTGTPQGGIISPLLANIYLHNLDKYMESTNLNLTKRDRLKRRNQGLGNYLYARYADDFVVLCNGTKEQAQRTKEEIGGFLSSIGLTLSEEKTKITHITEGFTFLGYEIIRCMGGQGKLIPQVRVPDKAIKRFQHKVREILAPGTTNESINTKIMAANQLIRGWCLYYRCVSKPNIPFHKVRAEIYWDMAHWLGRKYRTSLAKVIREYGRDNTFATKTVKLLMPNEFKAIKCLIRKWHNPYTEKGEIKREKILFYENLWLGTEAHRHGWMDIREEIMLLKGTTCYICGNVLHPSEVEIDHTTKPRAAFKDKKEADRMKHLQPICTSCHRAKTKTDLEVLSRMR